ncbi:hypothetical protein NMY22_g10778 [Coprinellus aureogranulatus]|nr:hypothetical protein NMY22_g10778 [Coprinellus aureogranulatus]
MVSQESELSNDRSSSGLATQITWSFQPSDASHPSSSHPCEHCGKEYLTPYHLEIHQRSSCDPSKRKLSELLFRTKEFWATRKRRRLNTGLPEPIEVGGRAHDVDADVHGAIQVSSEAILRNPSGSSSFPAPSAHAGSRPNHDSSTGNTERRPQVVPELCSDVGENVEVRASPAWRKVTQSDDDIALQPRGDLDVPVAIRKPKRVQRRPERYGQDNHVLPQALPSVEAVEEAQDAMEATRPKAGKRRAPRLVLHKSKRNAFGVVRAYRLPRGSTLTHDPDQTLTLRDLTDNIPSKAGNGPAGSHPHDINNKGWGPFSSSSAFLLVDWYWRSKDKSFRDFQALISIFKSSEFSLSQVVSVDWKAAFKALGANREDLPDHEGAWIQDDGWKKSPVTIDVPFHFRMRNPGTESYMAGTLHHRSIVSVIKEKIKNTSDSQAFHYQPYKATWKPTGEAPERELYGELYASRAFRDAHEKVQALPGTPVDFIWRNGIVALLPFLRKRVKISEVQPSERLGEQIAYFIKLPDTFDDYLQKRNDGRAPTEGLFTHCAREVFQKQWSLMLDDELLDAMKHGLVLLCPDGRRRCFYPRIFTYSADYPEKQVPTLIAGLRNNGLCPCHRCLIEKCDIWMLGAPSDSKDRVKRRRNEDKQKKQVDSARDEIEAGFAVDGKRIDHHLKDWSLVPVHSSFRSRLADTNFKIAPALVVDLMHEFEIGMDRSGPTLTGDLDSRYRATPSFGRDGIRSFAQNATEMKRKAARDYEDLLQCAIPAFDSLLPDDHNKTLMKLLYIFAQWHALAKLRLHHDGTLQLLDYTTTWLGAQTRLFNHTTCVTTQTKELLRESEARERREGKGKSKEGAVRKAVKFNIFTIKFHFLGDYTESIKLYGTTDSFSTETGELFHRLPKAWYERTDRKEYEGQLSQIERRNSRLEQIRQSNSMGGALRGSASVTHGPSGECAVEDANPSSTVNPEGREGMQDMNYPGASRVLDHSQSQPAADKTEGEKANSSRVLPEPLPETVEDSPDSRYLLGVNQNFPVSLSFFSNRLVAVGDAEEPDPYVANFAEKLKEHILPRIVELLGFSAEEFHEEDWVNVTFEGLRLYSHKLLHVNFTTYDVRRDQDIIHVDTPQCNVLLLNGAFAQHPSSTSVHPYLYAKILRLYHANVSYVGRLPDGTVDFTSHRIDFAWVHWYDFLPSEEEFVLDRVSLKSLDSELSTGFIDPSDILRAVHIIPQFSLGRPESPPPRSLCLPEQDVWAAYYINRFADRDLFMRYQYGLAVGHTYMHRAQAEIPSIPRNFDHYLTFPEEEVEVESDDGSGLESEEE